MHSNPRFFCSYFVPTSHKQPLSSYKVMSYSIPSSFQFPFPLSLPFSVTCLWLLCFDFAVSHCCRSLQQHWQLINIAFTMVKLVNMCFGSKTVFDLRQTHYPFPSSEICFRNMFPARLNWETFACATMFPSLARPYNWWAASLVRDQKYEPMCCPTATQNCHRNKLDNFYWLFFCMSLSLTVRLRAIKMRNTLFWRRK